MKWFITLALLPLTLLAQDAAPAVSFIQKIIAIIPQGGSAILICAALVEAVLRLVKTEKPKSILLVISAVCDSLALLFKAFSDFLNRVIPQNLK